MQLDLATKARHQTKQEMVYHAVRDAILRCELSPGQRLIIDDIAQQLRVSHIPVREALQLLQSEGLVETVPHSGASVAPISRDSVVEVFTVMEGLELVAARTAARRLTCESTDALLADLAAMDEAMQRGDREGWADLNSRFHRHIAGVPNMPMLQEMTDRVFDQWDRVRRYFFTSVLDQRVERAQQEHHAIVDAMRAGDLPRLEQLVHQHNQGALAAYIPYLETQDGDAT